MDERTTRKIKESILNHGDSFWVDVDCGVNCNIMDTCPKEGTPDCDFSNIHLLDDIIDCLNKDGYDLAVIEYHELDKALEGKSCRNQS